MAYAEIDVPKYNDYSTTFFFLFGLLREHDYWEMAIALFITITSKLNSSVVMHNIISF